MPAAAQIGASRFVLAAVTDPRGRPLVDVGPDDFVVQEGAAIREILSVRVADYPIAVLLDTGAGARPDFTAARAAVRHFVERLGADRAVMLVTFGGQPSVVATLEDDRAALLARLQRLEPGTVAGSRPLEAAALAAATIHATGTLFGSVVIVSSAPAEVGQAAVDAALGPILDGGTTVHIVARRAKPDDRADDGRVLRSIAGQTHGEYTAIYSAASYQAALDRLADRLTSELMLEYLVPPGSKPSEVTVGIRVPGARVRGLGVAPK